MQRFAGPLNRLVQLDLGLRERGDPLASLEAEQPAAATWGQTWRALAGLSLTQDVLDVLAEHNIVHPTPSPDFNPYRFIAETESLRDDPLMPYLVERGQFDDTLSEREFWFDLERGRRFLADAETLSRASAAKFIVTAAGQMIGDPFNLVPLGTGLSVVRGGATLARAAKLAAVVGGASLAFEELHNQLQPASEEPGPSNEAFALGAGAALGAGLPIIASPVRGGAAGFLSTRRMRQLRRGLSDMMTEPRVRTIDPAGVRTDADLPRVTLGDELERGGAFLDGVLGEEPTDNRVVSVLHAEGDENAAKLAQLREKYEAAGKALHVVEHPEQRFYELSREVESILSRADVNTDASSADLGGGWFDRAFAGVTRRYANLQARATPGGRLAQTTLARVQDVYRTLSGSAQTITRGSATDPLNFRSGAAAENIKGVFEAAKDQAVMELDRIYREIRRGGKDAATYNGAEIPARLGYGRWREAVGDYARRLHARARGFDAELPADADPSIKAGAEVLVGHFRKMGAEARGVELLGELPAGPYVPRVYAVDRILARGLEFRDRVAEGLRRRDGLVDGVRVADDERPLRPEVMETLRANRPDDPRLEFPAEASDEARANLDRLLPDGDDDGPTRGAGAAEGGGGAEARGAGARPRANARRPFSKADVEARLVDEARRELPVDDAADLDTINAELKRTDENALFATAFAGKLPRELVEAIGNRTHLLRFLRTNVPRWAEGDDALLTLGADRYVEILENLAASGLRRAKKAIADAGPIASPQLRFMAWLHDNLPERQAERVKFEVLDRPGRSLGEGSSFEIAGHPFEVVRDGDDMLLVGESFETWLDALDSLPVDRGTLHTVPRSPDEFRTGDGVPDFLADLEADEAAAQAGRASRGPKVEGDLPDELRAAYRAEASAFYRRVAAHVHDTLTDPRHGHGVPDTADPFHRRVLDLDENELADFLVSDAELLLERYSRATSGRVAVRRAIQLNADTWAGERLRDGRPIKSGEDLKEYLGDTVDALERLARELRERGADLKLIHLVRNLRARVERDITLPLDVLEGRNPFGSGRGVFAPFAAMGRAGLRLSFANKLGSVAWAQINDLAPLSLHMMQRPRSLALIPRAIFHLKELPRRDLEMMGLMFDHVTRTRSLAETETLVDAPGFGGGIVRRVTAAAERGMQDLSDVHGRLSLLNWMTDKHKEIAGGLVMGKLVRGARRLVRADDLLKQGVDPAEALRRVKLSGYEAAWLNKLGLNGERARLFNDLVWEHGLAMDDRRIRDLVPSDVWRGGGGFNHFSRANAKPNFAEWDVSRPEVKDLRDTLLANISGEVHRSMVVTPGAFDRPVVNYTTLGRIFNQFQSFAIAFVNQRLRVMAQMPASYQLWYGMSYLFLGALSDAIASHLSGRRTLDETIAGWEENPLGMTYAAFERSGLSGWLSRPIAIADLMGVPFSPGNLLNAPTNSTASRHITPGRTLTLFGPVASDLDRMGQLIGDLGSGNVDDATAYNAARLAPFQNLVWLRLLHETTGAPVVPEAIRPLPKARADARVN